MKRLLTVIFATLLGLVSYSASAATFTIDVDNAENVEVGYNKSMWGGLYTQFMPYELQSGPDNTITTENETSFLVRVPTGSLAIIDSVTKNGEAVADYDNISIEEGMNIVIRTHVEDGAATCTVNCDDFSLVSLSVNENPIELNSNSRQVDFTRGDTFTIKHVDDTRNLAEVKLNGEVQTANYDNSYSLNNVANSDVIDIRAIPAEYDVTFSFNNDRAREYVTSVEVNGTEVADYAGGIKVQEGFYVYLKIDESITNVEVSVDGNVYPANPLFHEVSILVDRDLEIVVTASEVTEPDQKTVNVNVDRAANVNLYYVKAGIIPIWDENVPFELADGDNEIEIPEGVVTIYAEPATNCRLVEVKLNSEDVAIDPEKGNYALDVENGMNIYITSETLEATASFTLVCAEPSKIKLTLGETPYGLTADTEQTIKFIPETQNSLMIESAESDMPIKEVLHNGNSVEKLGTGFGGTPYYQIYDLKNGDRIEVTLPKMYNVTFTYGEGAREDYIDDVSLESNRIENFKDGFRAPEESTVSLYVVSTITDQTIYVNGIQQTPNTYSFVSFTVNEDTEVKVESSTWSSVETFDIESGNTVCVYGIDGLLITKGVCAEVLRELPAGCYIIEGRKVMVRR